MPVSKIGVNALSTGGPYWDSAGNVGIGTSSPGQRLQISNASSSGFAAIRMAADSRSYDVGVGGSASGFQQNNWYVYDVTGAATRLVLDTSGNLQFNSGYGSAATAYGCRAWVNFNGSGTVAIRSSGNVSSISDNGVGDYTVNFTNAMPDANYSINTTGNQGGASANAQVVMLNTASGPTTSAARLCATYINNAGGTGGATDLSYILVSVFR